MAAGKARLRELAVRPNLLQDNGIVKTRANAGGPARRCSNAPGSSIVLPELKTPLVTAVDQVPQVVESEANEVSPVEDISCTDGSICVHVQPLFSGSPPK